MRDSQNSLKDVGTGSFSLRRTGEEGTKEYTKIIKESSWSSWGKLLSGIVIGGIIGILLTSKK